MKIETLKPQFCQQGIGYDGLCGEPASYRITLEDAAISIAYCKDHAFPYINGKRVIAPLKCVFCKCALRPGYHKNERGDMFCTEAEMAAWDGSANSPAYR